MKRLPVFLLLTILWFDLPAQGISLFVSPSGNDRQEGSPAQPLATLSAALRRAREMRRLNDPAAGQGIRIVLHGGLYPTHEPVFIRPEDAGTASSPTRIEAAPGEQPVLSGGFAIGNWKRLTRPTPGLSPAAAAQVWVADLPDLHGQLPEFRQLWVNGRKATRARSANGNRMHRILSWNKTDQSCTIPLAGIPSPDKIVGAEMFIHQWWEIAILRISRVEVKGDRAVLFFHQPESRIQSEHPWPAPWISEETGNSAFFLSHAIQFLDEAGEWFLDVPARKLYYWPRPGEDMNRTLVEAPFSETLLRITGTADQPVSHIYFSGISFRHTGWLRPSQQGHVPHQAGMYMLDAYKLQAPGTAAKKTLENQAWVGRPAAAVEVSFADQIRFRDCRFEQMASTGLDLHKGVQDAAVSGNLFRDIGGTALLVGVFSDEAMEIHLPYNPRDQREVCDRLLINNNLVSDAANEDWGAVGIGLGYTRNSRVEHNEVEHVSYSGISMGWGWSPLENVMKNNRIQANRIHHFGKHNYDCAGIYTLSAQPGSVISENYVDSVVKAPYAHLPSHWFYLYADEGSSGISWQNNWTPSTKYLQNANGPGNAWTNNGPGVDAHIRLNAGLEKEYQSLLAFRSADLQELPINEEHDEVIELVLKEGSSLDLEKLKTVLAENGMDPSALYRWQDHYLYLGKVQDLGVVKGRLQNRFPGTTVRVYHDLFYSYEKRKHCPDKSTAGDWDHVILTANLVKDPALQQEYLDYHATQLEKWPEVSAGFCRAGFQRLFLFRNGRQLVLVISIPRGSSLDELNPLTTKDNPRMVEWNTRMKKYQEALPDAPAGAVWVELTKIKD